MNASSHDARAAAERLFRSGLVEDRELLETGTIGEPLPVRDRGRAVAGWFVPVTNGDRLCAFFQLDARLTLLRYSAFAKNRCPSARSWLDEHAVADIALQQFRDDSLAHTPFLTYDRDVSRLVWAVPVRNPNGERTIFVTGDYAYLPSDDDQVTG
jgi:hypothetical protein